MHANKYYTGPHTCPTLTTRPTYLCGPEHAGCDAEDCRRGENRDSGGEVCKTHDVEGIAACTSKHRYAHAAEVHDRRREDVRAYGQWVMVWGMGCGYGRCDIGMHNGSLMKADETTTKHQQQYKKPIAQERKQYGTRATLIHAHARTGKDEVDGGHGLETELVVVEFLGENHV